MADLLFVKINVGVLTVVPKMFPGYNIQLPIVFQMQSKENFMFKIFSFDFKNDYKPQGQKNCPSAPQEESYVILNILIQIIICLNSFKIFYSDASCGSFLFIVHFPRE